MMNIKSKVTIIFLVFNIILFINMFRKLKEPNLLPTCDSYNGGEPISPESLFECKKNGFKCLSKNCNKQINGIYNVHLTGKNNPLDEWNQNLAAYCCEKCRNTGGCECDTTCTSQDNPVNTNIPHGLNKSSGYCVNNYKPTEAFTSKVKEGFSTVEHGDRYHASLILGSSNKGYECEDGIIDPANCDCYSEEDHDFTTQPDSKSSTNCGPYRFFKCHNDASCITRFNSIRMNSFTNKDGTHIKEPKDSSTWGQNIVNIISDPIFNGKEWQWKGKENGQTHFYSEGRVINNLKKSSYDTWVHGDAYSSALADVGGVGWCQDICNKASNIDNENGAWDDRLDLLELPAVGSTPSACAQSDVQWAAKFFCQSCNMYDHEGGVSYHDSALAPYKCHKDAVAKISTDVSNKYNWNYVDANGGDAAEDFVIDNVDGNYIQHGTLISPDSYIPPTTWNEDRDLTHLQYYCRAACGQELSEKCHQDQPSYSDMDKIRNHCRAVCKKRLPCPNFIKRLASLSTPVKGDGEEEVVAWERTAPDFDNNSVLPCPTDEDEKNGFKEIWPGACKKEGGQTTSVTWEELRSDIFGLGVN